jgi:hypothetical protein
MPAQGLRFIVDASRADTLTLEGSAVSVVARRKRQPAVYAKAPGLKGRRCWRRAERPAGRRFRHLRHHTAPYMHGFNAHGPELATSTSSRAVFCAGSQNGGGFLLGGLTTSDIVRIAPHAQWRLGRVCIFAFLTVISLTLGDTIGYLITPAAACRNYIDGLAQGPPRCAHAALSGDRLSDRHERDGGGLCHRPQHERFLTGAAGSGWLR